MNSPKEVTREAEIKAHFEQNMLDGDEVQKGQMLSSEAVLEYLTEAIKEAEVAARLDEVELAHKGTMGKYGHSIQDQIYFRSRTDELIDALTPQGDKNNG